MAFPTGPGVAPGRSKAAIRATGFFAPVGGSSVRPAGMKQGAFAYGHGWSSGVVSFSRLVAVTPKETSGALALASGESRCPAKPRRVMPNGALAGEKRTWLISAPCKDCKPTATPGCRCGTADDAAHDNRSPGTTPSRLFRGAALPPSSPASVWPIRRQAYRPKSKSRDSCFVPVAFSSPDSRETCCRDSPPRSGSRSLCCTIPARCARVRRSARAIFRRDPCRFRARLDAPARGGSSDPFRDTNCRPRSCRSAPGSGTGRPTSTSRS